MLLQILCTILVKFFSPVRELIFGRLFCAVAISAMSRASCWMLHSFMSFHDFSFYFSFSIFIFAVQFSSCLCPDVMFAFESPSSFLVQQTHTISAGGGKKIVQSEAGQGTVCYSFVGGHSPNYIANELPTSSSRTAEPSWTARNVSCRRRRGKIGKHKNKRSLAHTFSQIRDVFRFLKYPFSHIFTLSLHRTHTKYERYGSISSSNCRKSWLCFCVKRIESKFSERDFCHTPHPTRAGRLLDDDDDVYSRKRMEMEKFLNSFFFVLSLALLLRWTV